MCYVSCGVCRVTYVVCGASCVVKYVVLVCVVMCVERGVRCVVCDV